MTVQISDDGRQIKIVVDGKTTRLDKAGLKIKEDGDYVYIQSSSISGDFRIKYDEVTSPAGISSAAQLAALIEGYLEYIKIIRIPGSTVGGGGATQYSLNDLVGSKLTLTDAVPGAGGSSYLMGITIEDLSKQNGALDIVLFDSDPSGTTFTDNAAFDIADADLAKVIGFVSIASTDYSGFNDNSTAIKTLINLLCQGNGSSNLYAAIVSRDTKTYVANELSIKFHFEKVIA
jgi:hypothetical protein